MIGISSVTKGIKSFTQSVPSRTYHSRLALHHYSRVDAGRVTKVAVTVAIVKNILYRKQAKEAALREATKSLNKKINWEKFLKDHPDPKSKQSLIANTQILTLIVVNLLTPTLDAFLANVVVGGYRGVRTFLRNPGSAETQAQMTKWQAELEKSQPVKEQLKNFAKKITFWKKRTPSPILVE